MKTPRFIVIFILLLLNQQCFGYGKTCEESQTLIPMNDLPSSMSSLISSPLEKYEASKIELLGTVFFVVARVNGGLGKDKLSKAICLAWPKWRQIFSNKIEKIALIDSNEQYVGGGPVGRYAFNVYLGGAVRVEAAPYLESMLGWTIQPTASNYIMKYYENFEDPMQAYVNDTVTHELGHSFFGWGITQVELNPEQWFALGLGLVYDRIVWNQISNQVSPLFSATVNRYLEKFSQVPELDQHLIKPDTKNDSDFFLVRSQTYDHGKALVYLSELRNRLGITRFDELVRIYLARPYSSNINYDDFLTYLTPKELELVKSAEAAFEVR